MLNLSEIMREHYSPLRLLASYHDPELFLAENMRDFLENAPRLPYPWYKDFPVISRDRARAYIIVRDIGIRSIYSMGKEVKRDNFLVHDATGHKIMNWEIDRPIWKPLHSWEEAHEKDGLTDDDWVYDILFCYLLRADIAFIIQVRKFRFSKIAREKKSIRDRIRDSIPDLELVPETVWSTR